MQQVIGDIMKLTDERRMLMRHAPFYPSALIAMAFYTLPAFAADVAGKWYGRLDAEPVITINKSGAEYSATLDYPDTTQTVMRGSRISSDETVHKDIASFKIAGSNVQFTIRDSVSENGDLNYERDEYNLNLLPDVGQMVGTEKRTISFGDGEPHMTVAPITLFSTDWNSRSTRSQH